MVEIAPFFFTVHMMHIGNVDGYSEHKTALDPSFSIRSSSLSLLYQPQSPRKNVPFYHGLEHFMLFLQILNVMDEKSRLGTR